MSTHSIEQFFKLLKQSPPGPIFNPWWDFDRQNDIARSAPMIRRRQLRTYLKQRLGRAKIVVIGEALGYRGGHFTGIPMTSERILLGKKPEILATVSERREQAGSENGSDPDNSELHIMSGFKARRTSKPSICADGFSEPTASIVWGSLLRLGVLPGRFVLWNAFPWHSFDPQRGILSNRMSNKSEQLIGRSVLKVFLELFRCNQIVALGKLAAAQLEQLGVNPHCVRHPASGGARLFRQQIALILR